MKARAELSEKRRAPAPRRLRDRRARQRGELDRRRRERRLPNEVQLAEKRRVLNFATPNFLGVKNDYRLIRACHQALDSYGVGSPGARLLDGTLVLHESVERLVAEHLGTETSVLFNSGYAALIGLFGALRGAAANLHLLLDEEAAPAVVDAARAVRARVSRFSADDPVTLAAALSDLPPSATPAVVLESVYPYSARVVDLPVLLLVCENAGARSVLLDDLLYGVVGEGGAGLAAAQGCVGRIDFTVVAMSTALGIPGGFIACRTTEADLLRYTGRSFVFSSSLSPAMTAALAVLVRRIRGADATRARIEHAFGLARERLDPAGFSVARAAPPLFSIEPRVDAGALRAAFAELGVALDLAAPGGRRPRLIAYATAKHDPRQIDRLAAAVSDLRHEIVEIR